jgi:serine phosphatase RsbU (regulator of sigma subunit)
VPTGTLVVLYSDGLVERRGVGAADLDVRALVTAARGSTPAEVADGLVAAADAAGQAADDTSVLVSRL